MIITKMLIEIKSRAVSERNIIHVVVILLSIN